MSECKSAHGVYPVLALKGVVVLPAMTIALGVGRPKSVRALEAALEADRQILLVAQHDEQVDDPKADDLHDMGVLARVVNVGKQPDGVLQVMVEGVVRARLMDYVHLEPYLAVRPILVEDPEDKPVELEALMRGVTTQFERFARLSRSVAPEAFMTVMGAEAPGRFADLVAQHVQLKVEERQKVIELDVKARLEFLAQVLGKEINILDLERKIQNRVRKSLEKSQREYYLKEQIKAIQQELGEKDDRSAEVDEYRKKIEEAGLPENVKEKALDEVARLEKMPPMVAEAVVVRTYLDWILALPWTKATEDRLDIAEARRILESEHYGLKKAKDRIVEYLAVRKLSPQSKGPILCFVGPPGVGKTSLGKSIAKAMGRKFVRISLGGVRDEAEIRGHRRTYVGALPGRIIQGMKTAGTKNPVFMLDEIDKLGMDFRGDPSSALLEALDPEQNNAFSDHYLDLPFDLRDVMFVCTANLLDTIPPALRDRLEVIRFAGYTEEEKLHIARQFLVPKQRRENGLESRGLQMRDEALRKISREYTREAGVRNLEREIGTICRKIATRVASEEKGVPKRITAPMIAKMLGPVRFRYGIAGKEDEIGVATGLVWTEMGGDIVTVEASLVKGSGKVSLTGQLGEVMKESAQAAVSYVRSRSRRFHIEEEWFSKFDVHVHVPAGAVPKDGPSAGITMATALASVLTNRPVRKDLAMTGEITLRGRVLPIGGLKEKVLAAHRSGLRTVILPQENEKDLHEIPENVRRRLRFKIVEHMDDVIDEALLPALPRPAAPEALSPLPAIEMPAMPIEVPAPMPPAPPHA
jgi:ATP-dependent Lon protease